jgi:hypothetical protein
MVANADGMVIKGMRAIIGLFELAMASAYNEFRVIRRQFGFNVQALELQFR